MIQIDEKIYFYLLLLLPFLGLVFLFGQWRRKKLQRLFAESSALKRLAPERSVFKNWVKFIAFCMILLALILALANPKVGSKLDTIKREGVDIVFAVDVSKSMLADDVKPNRLEKAKYIISQVMERLAGDRIGFVPYAGQAFPQLPLTNDYAAARMFLQNMNTDMLSSQGTAIHEAIRVANNYFDVESPTAKLIFILSDGEDHEEGGTQIAQQTIAKGIKIHTIGIGTEKGSPISIVENGARVLKRNKEGEVVITKRNELLLQQIAEEAGGTYNDGNHSQAILKSIETILEQTEKAEYQSQIISDYKDQFQWFLGLALVLLLLDWAIFNKKTRWVQYINLFGEKK